MNRKEINTKIYSKEGNSLRINFQLHFANSVTNLSYIVKLKSKLIILKWKIS